MPQQPVPHTDLRKAGLAAALVVGLLLAAGLAVVALTRRPSSPPPIPGTQPPGPNPEVTPDIVDKGLSTRTARVQFADKKDPGRAAGMIEWASLEPISQVEKLLTEPRGYIYLRDGGLVVVASKSGRLNTTPKVEEPQSGRFEGGVTLKLYPAGTDPKADAPTLTATSDSLDFDLPSASLATTGPFSLRSTAFDIDGSGMRLIVNQVEEGIERFEVARVNQVLIRPDARDPLQSKGFTGTQTARATPNARGGLDRLRTYRTLIEGAVRITQVGRTMTADRAEVWAHVINNRLAPGSIGRFGPDPLLTGSCPDTGEETGALLSATPDAPKPPAPPLSALTSPVDGPDTTIKAAWTGRMVLVPVDEKSEFALPAEFGDNKVALRLHAGAEPVTIDDESFKGTMSAARVDFGATSRVLTLASTPAIPVKINAVSAGSLQSAGATVNLGTGRIDLAGPGDLTPAADALDKAAPGAPAAPRAADTPPTTLHFNNALTLNFATIGHFITPDARSASIKGGFKATSGEVTASADEATVLFAPRINDKNALQEIRLSGNAVAGAPAATATGALAPAAAKPGIASTSRDTLKGQQMTFKFEPDPATGQEQPRSVEVTGGAEATAGGSGESGLNLKARTITAKLGKDSKGQLAVVNAEASEEVHISDNPVNGSPTLSAAADRLSVDPATGIAHLYGSPVTVSRDGAVMTGAHLRLTQAAGEVFADGPGTISSIKEGDPAKHEETTYALASWSKSMTFNNTTGTAVCVGDASATMTIGDTQRSILQASTVNLDFTPAPKAGENASAPRELITAEAVGELGVDGKPPRPATLEHRQFTIANGEQKLDQLVYLEGSRILANQQLRTLDVPVAGKLLVDDRTPDPAKANAPPSPPAPAGAATPINPLGGFTSSKGTSLFTWAGSLHLSMIDGKAELKRDVALTHQPLALPGQPGPTQTTLDCDQLTAFLKTTPAPAPAAPAPMGKLDATLERVEATGNVIVKNEGKQLAAHSLQYDTVRQFMEAAGKDGTDQPLATFLDPSRPAPLRARRFTWDQKNGEVRIIEPAPTTIGN